MTARILRNGFLLSTVLASAGLAGQAMAQSAPNQLEEIVVTARKTSEKLQVTPVAVTALTTQGLERRQVAEVVDLQRTTPNLNITHGGTAPSTLVILSLRGQAQNSPNSASDSAVGIYYDNVYVGRPAVGNLGFLDIGSAEILRGPQGTLFGRNTTGGAMLINTNKPTFRNEGYVKVGVGNYDQRLVETVINTPLSDDVATRIAVRYNENSGYIKNPITGGRQQGVDGSYFARAAVQWNPEDKPFTLNVTGEYMHYRDTGNPTYVIAQNIPLLRGTLTALNLQPLGLLLTVPTAAQTAAGFRQATGAEAATATNQANAALAQMTPYLGTDANFRQSFGNTRTGQPIIDHDGPYNLNINKAVSANFDLDLGEVHLKSISGYRESDTDGNYDIDGTPARIISFDSRYTQRQFSEELQLSGKFDKLDWLTGLTYFQEKGTERSLNETFGAPEDFVATSHRPFALTLSDFRATSVGAFAQINYHFTDRLRATAGFRYTWDTRNINRHGMSDYERGQCNVGPYSAVPSAGPVSNCNEPHTANFQYPAWTAGFDYKFTDDLFAYIKTSGASMAGGFNTRTVPVGNESFQPEHEKDVELGFKADLFDKHLRTNTAVFYSWNSGVQRIVNDIVNSSLTQYVKNAGKTKNYGVEFEGTVLPWDGMEVTGNVAYLHTKYVKGTFTEPQNIGTSSAPIFVIVDKSGEPVPFAPKWNAGLSLNQSFNVPWGKVSLHGDWAYTSSKIQNVASAAPAASAATKAAVALSNDASTIRAYSLFNARVAFNIADPDLEIAFWGKNITNKKYLTYIFTNYTALGIVTGNQGEPRTYGVTATYHW